MGLTKYNTLQYAKIIPMTSRRTHQFRQASRLLVWVIQVTFAGSGLILLFWANELGPTGCPGDGWMLTWSILFFTMINHCDLYKFQIMSTQFALNRKRTK